MSSFPPIPRVYFFFFEGGVNPIDFEPLGLFRSERLRPGEWTEPEIFGHKGEVCNSQKVYGIKRPSP